MSVLADSLHGGHPTESRLPRVESLPTEGGAKVAVLSLLIGAVLLALSYGLVVLCDRLGGGEA